MDERRHRRVARRCAASPRRSSSPRTRRCRPATIASRRISSRSTSARCATRCGIGYDELHGARPRQPARRRRDVLHDGARAEAVAAAPTPCRRCTARSRARCGRRSIPGRTEEEVPIGHITNGVHVPHAGSRRRCASSTTATSGPTGRSALRRPGLLGSDRRRRRRRAVGDAPDAQGAADRVRAPARGRSTPSARGESPDVRRAAAPRAQPRRADDRLRAALRHLQAREPAAAGHRSARRAGQRPAAAGAVRLRRQGAPARRAGQGRSCSRSPA